MHILMKTQYLPQTMLQTISTFCPFVTFFEDFTEEIREYTINYFRKILSNLGWEPQKSDKHTDAFLRGFAIFALGKLDDEQILEMLI